MRSLCYRCHKAAMPSMLCWRPAKRRKGPPCMGDPLPCWAYPDPWEVSRVYLLLSWMQFGWGSLGVPNLDWISFNGWSMLKCSMETAFSKATLQIKASAKRFRAIGWRYHMADIEFYTKGLQGFKTKHSQTIPWEYPNKRYCHQLGIAEICHQTRRKMMMNPQGPIVGRKLCSPLVFTSKQLANGCLILFNL